MANRPSAGDGPKTAFIVAIPALVDQWMKEVEKGVKSGVLPGALHIMQTADVVLTTYKDGDIRQNRRGTVDPRRCFRHPGFLVKHLVKSDWLMNHRKSMYQAP